MSTSVWYYDWEYWYLYHKVTFDGRRKLILVNEGVIELDWKADVYSAWKQWVQLDNHLENPGFLQAMRSTGGDFITSDGSRRVGGTFFLMNGWRLKTWSGSHRLSINGNVYTEEGDPIYVPHDGNYGVVIEQTLSSLVETVTAGVGGTDPGSIPTATQIANEVWSRMTAVNNTQGTFGEALNTIKSVGDSSAVQLTQANSTLDTLTVDLGIVSDKLDIAQDKIDILTVELDTVVDKLDDANIKLDSATDLITTLLKYEKNRTKIDPTAKTMTVYDDDGTTVLKVFDLKDFTGASSITQIAERAPR